jgi:hypothetical protein
MLLLFCAVDALSAWRVICENTNRRASTNTKKGSLSASLSVLCLVK